eukprot:CAMPEP_0116844460 /NCGR_PEP_ID=MMETSP0418-20121206/12705_1 /TAXON_ID=1158023 /ORGANISM="Astrosyne radiata, Strain 13vi08-1A" /LENGTH=260 /DNA_ID=CAMNT_0004475425 /DNA_START=38 /DNA_END=817 /DNA_ORIENTATION=+
MADFFTKVTNEILDASEQLAARLEDGLSVIMSGKLSGQEEEAAGEKAPTPTSSSQQEMPSFGEDDDFVMSEVDEDMTTSPLEGIAEGVLKDVFKDQVGPQTPMEHFNAFRSAVHWSEPFILSILAFQIVMFCLCLYVSRKGVGIAPRLTIMIFVGALVRGAEYINGWGARHWESFATQNYFDKQGIFVGIFLCGPLLLDCFLMLILFLREASQLLVEVKTQELKQKKKGKKQQDNKKETATTTTTTTTKGRSKQQKSSKK